MTPARRKAEELVAFRKQVREAFAEYYSSEGCSCCQNVDAHKKAEQKLGKLLKVKKYSDGSGYDFSKYKPN